jgi:DNA-binding CsgD family transcriptional regulator
MLAMAERRPELARNIVRMGLLAYTAGVRALLHAEAGRFYDWLAGRMEQYNFEWSADVARYRRLELVQRGEFLAARTADVQSLPAGHPDYQVWIGARALLELRAGSTARARALLDEPASGRGLTRSALLGCARLELATIDGEEAAGDLAAMLYERAQRRGFARLAAAAAVVLARSGRPAPSRPPWLAATAPLSVFWAWAEGIAHDDRPGLRVVAAGLTALACPYEAALARADAGDLQESYRALRRLGAPRGQEDVAGRLRAAGIPIPRGPARGEPGGLTDTERAICRLVAAGATNVAIAAELRMGVRTVEAHLGRIYQKTGRRGRAALAAWCAEQGLDPSATLDLQS